MKSGKILTGVMGLLAAVSLGSFADGLSAPRITLSVAGEPLTTVLERISKQAGVAIVMTNAAAGREAVSMRVRNAELENALDQALSSYNYTLSFSAEQNVISKVVVTVQEKKEGAIGGNFESGKLSGSTEYFWKDANAVNAAGVKYAESVAHLQREPKYPAVLSQEVINGIGKGLDIALKQGGAR